MRNPFFLILYFVLGFAILAKDPDIQDLIKKKYDAQRGPVRANGISPPAGWQKFDTELVRKAIDGGQETKLSVRFSLPATMLDAPPKSQKVYRNVEFGKNKVLFTMMTSPFLGSPRNTKYSAMLKLYGYKPSENESNQTDPMLYKVKKTTVQMYDRVFFVERADTKLIVTRSKTKSKMNYTISLFEKASDELLCDLFFLFEKKESQNETSIWQNIFRVSGSVELEYFPDVEILDKKTADWLKKRKLTKISFVDTPTATVAKILTESLAKGTGKGSGEYIRIFAVASPSSSKVHAEAPKLGEEIELNNLEGDIVEFDRMAGAVAPSYKIDEENISIYDFLTKLCKKTNSQLIISTRIALIVPSTSGKSETIKSAKNEPETNKSNNDPKQEENQERSAEVDD